MRNSRTMSRAFAVIVGAGAALAALSAPAAEGTAPAEPAVSAELSVADVKQLFASQCSWCHGAYGMKADKGPQLAGTLLSEKKVFDLIKNGKSGLMPSFKRALNDEEIAAMAKYIKSLKAEI